MREDHDYCDIPNISPLTEYKHQAIGYIAGFVAKSVGERLLCLKCKAALKSNYMNNDTFLMFKNRGGLTKLSASVTEICEEAEKCFQRMLAVTSGKLPQSVGLMNAFSIAVLGNIGSKTTFRELEDHITDSALGDNHIIHLIKEVTKCYCKIRFKHLGVMSN